MLLHLLLVASVLTPLNLGAHSFWSVTHGTVSSNTVNLVASCAPTQPEDEADEADEDEKVLF
ncbi:hypothetical protein [Phormidium tenue]|uniref:Uncharacterized protein n=1 Tax=Phormidium tenue NIES-30 TaxID=549789 RepID=A0A1U7IYW1_9CYAN|nr:hypothetical protein [Phormidium tenue]MBD2234740.1 hypothetical protein [Phormidium tenue FACHB-1052]OKH43946.1 hypothetical protein NIES30_23685 [Phormidium tenue NIES-30]